MLNRLVRCARCSLATHEGRSWDKPSTSRGRPRRRLDRSFRPARAPGSALLASGLQSQAACCSPGNRRGCRRGGRGRDSDAERQERDRAAAGGGKERSEAGCQRPATGSEALRGQLRAPWGRPWGEGTSWPLWGHVCNKGDRASTGPAPRRSPNPKFPGVARPEGGPHGGNPDARRQQTKARVCGEDGSELGVRIHRVAFCAGKQTSPGTWHSKSPPSCSPQRPGPAGPVVGQTALESAGNRPCTRFSSWLQWNHVCFCESVYYTQSSGSVASDSATRRTAPPGFPVHRQLPELAETPVHRVSDAVQPSCPRSPPSSRIFSLNAEH